jgi:hypothetical protein
MISVALAVVAAAVILANRTADTRRRVERIARTANRLAENAGPIGLR